MADRMGNTLFGSDLRLALSSEQSHNKLWSSTLVPVAKRNPNTVPAVLVVWSMAPLVSVVNTFIMHPI